MVTKQSASPLRILPQASAGEQSRIAVLGASGYTGAEVARLLALHPNFKITVLTGETQAGKVPPSSAPERISRALLKKLEVLYNLFEANIDLFRYPTAVRRAILYSSF